MKQPVRIQFIRLTYQHGVLNNKQVKHWTKAIILVNNFNSMDSAQMAWNQPLKEFYIKLFSFRLTPEP